MEILGKTLDMLGKVLVAYTAIRVHHRVWKDHKVDKAVFMAMKREQYIGVLGIVLIIVGYILEIYPKI